MKVGDKVKFVGDIQSYTVEGQRNLKRVGEITGVGTGERYSGLGKGEFRVKWVPKTKRGYPAYYRHRANELEPLDTAIASK